MTAQIELATIPRARTSTPISALGAVDAFEEDGAWLLLSQVWYGWRGYYDLACGAHRGPRPEVVDDSRPVPITTEYQIVVDLQVQAFLYAAAEQFATLLRAMRHHEHGTTRFFEAYVDAPTDLRSLVEDVAGLTRTEIVSLVGDPSSAPRSEPTRSAVLDPEGTDVVEVGGLLVPQAVITAAEFDGLVEKAQR